MGILGRYMGRSLKIRYPSMDHLFQGWGSSGVSVICLI